MSPSTSTTRPLPPVASNCSGASPDQPRPPGNSWSSIIAKNQGVLHACSTIRLSPLVGMKGTGDNGGGSKRRGIGKASMTGGGDAENDKDRYKRDNSFGGGLLVASVSRTLGGDSGGDSGNDSSSDEANDSYSYLEGDDGGPHQFSSLERRGSLGPRRSIVSQQVMALADAAANDVAAGSAAHSNLIQRMNIVSHG